MICLPPASVNLMRQTVPRLPAYSMIEPLGIVSLVHPVGDRFVLGFVVLGRLPDERRLAAVVRLHPLRAVNAPDEPPNERGEVLNLLLQLHDPLLGRRSPRDGGHAATS